MRSIAQGSKATVIKEKWHRGEAGEKQGGRGQSKRGHGWDLVSQGSKQERHVPMCYVSR